MKTLNLIETNVQECLKYNEHFRQCDKCLIFHYWETYDNIIDYSNEDNRHGLTSPESIRRSRQKIQSRRWVDKAGVVRYGMYLPDSEIVRKKRKISEEAYKLWCLDINK